MVTLRSDDAVPADEAINEGEVYVDESPLTGEPTNRVRSSARPESAS
jgi:cation transport ATPase